MARGNLIHHARDSGAVEGRERNHAVMRAQAPRRAKLETGRGDDEQPRSASARNRSSDVGSAQCRSSNASTTGCDRAPARIQAVIAANCLLRNSSGAKLAARPSGRGMPTSGASRGAFSAGSRPMRRKVPSRSARRSSAGASAPKRCRPHSAIGCHPHDRHRGCPARWRSGGSAFRRRSMGPRTSFRRPKQSSCSKKGCDLLVVGTGQDGNVRLSPEASAYFGKKDCRVVLQADPRCHLDLQPVARQENRAHARDLLTQMRRGRPCGASARAARGVASPMRGDACLRGERCSPARPSRCPRKDLAKRPTEFELGAERSDYAIEFCAMPGEAGGYLYTAISRIAISQTRFVFAKVMKGVSAYDAADFLDDLCRERAG